MQWTRSRCAKRRSSVPRLEAVWKGLEEAGLMDLSGSHYNGGGDAGGGSSANMSMSSESSFEGVSQGETERCSVSKKVVPGHQRRGRRRATGDGVVRGEHPLKGKKCGGVSIRGRCALDRVVSMKKAMKKFQKRAVKVTMLRPVLKYTKFAMERNLALALVKCWVPQSRAFRLVERLVPFSVFDITLLTGLPATGEMVSFDDDGTMTKIGEMVWKRVGEEEEKEGWREEQG